MSLTPSWSASSADARRAVAADLGDDQTRGAAGRAMRRATGSGVGVARRGLVAIVHAPESQQNRTSRSQQIRSSTALSMCELRRFVVRICSTRVVDFGATSPVRPAVWPTACGSQPSTPEGVHAACQRSTRSLAARPRRHAEFVGPMPRRQLLAGARRRGGAGAAARRRPAQPARRPGCAPRPRRPAAERHAGAAGVGDGHVRLATTPTRSPTAPGDGRGHRRPPASTSRSTPSTTTPSRRTSPPTCSSPTTSFAWFAGYRMRFFAAKGLRRRHLRRLGRACDDFSEGFKIASTGTTASSTSCRSTTTLGRPLPQEPVRGEGLRRSRRPGTSSKALADQMQADGHHPVRCGQRRQVAGDGHVRHAQPPHQRLPVPRRPDGRQGELDRRQGQGRLRARGPSCCRSTRRPQRPHVAGGRHRARATRKPA